MMGTILVFNVGSSSIKFAVYPVDEHAESVLAGTISGIGRSPILTTKSGPEAESFGSITSDEERVIAHRTRDFCQRVASSVA